MSQKIDSKDQEIINELTDIEYSEDDALTLLDDEEIQNPNRDIEDEDLASFYLDYPEETKNLSEKVDLYTEEVIEEEFILEDNNIVDDIQESVVEQKSLDELNQQERYQQAERINKNIDAYLNGSLENKSKDEVLVEKIEQPTVISSNNHAQPVYVKPVEEKTIMVEKVTPPRMNDVDYSNLNQLFAKVEDNVKGASDIVNRNAEIKRKIDERYNELQKLQMEHDKNKQSDYAEINAYKDEVYNKLKVKKLEIEDELTTLRRQQEIFEKEKAEVEKEKVALKSEREIFEKNKSETFENISRKEKELHDTYEERVKNIEQVENGLIRRKEQLDIEKIAIVKDKEQVDIEKKELADNLVKFNQLVDNFTKGVDRFNETN